jgi:hypothetical protein
MDGNPLAAMLRIPRARNLRVPCKGTAAQRISNPPRLRHMDDFGVKAN